MKFRILAFGCVTIVAATAFVLAAPQESPGPAPKASEETLKGLANRGAYRFSLELTDSAGKSLARSGGIRTREAFAISPVISENPQAYEISAELLTVENDELVIRFDVAHRTEIKHDISLQGIPHGSATWRSENVRLIETITVDDHRTFELDAIKDGEGRPVRLIVGIDRFRYPEKSK